MKMDGQQIQKKGHEQESAVNDRHFAYFLREEHNVSSSFLQIGVQAFQITKTKELLPKNKQTSLFETTFFQVFFAELSEILP